MKAVFLLLSLVLTFLSVTTSALAGCGAGYHVCLMNRCCANDPTPCHRCLMNRCCDSFSDEGTKIFEQMGAENESILVDKAGQATGAIRSTETLACVQDARTLLVSCFANQ